MLRIKIRNLCAFGITLSMAGWSGHHLLHVSGPAILILYGCGVLPCWFIVRMGWLD